MPRGHTRSLRVLPLNQAAIPQTISHICACRSANRKVFCLTLLLRVSRADHMVPWNVPALAGRALPVPCMLTLLLPRS